MFIETKPNALMGKAYKYIGELILITVKKCLYNVGYTPYIYGKTCKCTGELILITVK